MKKSKFNLPHIKQQLAWSLAQGHSQTEIAKALGTSQPTISRLSRQDDALKMIEEEETRLLKIELTLLRKIKKDHRFLNEFQKHIEERMFSYLSYIPRRMKRA